eukprot:12821624-Alexandrium_andersonii.AAC.1
MLAAVILREEPGSAVSPAGPARVSLGGASASSAATDVLPGLLQVLAEDDRVTQARPSLGGVSTPT